MPRRAFVADLQKAQDGLLPPNIHDLQQGDDDGQFEFVFTTQSNDDPVKITAMITDLSAYPASHEYMIFCDDDTPLRTTQAIENMRGINRKSVFELLELVSGTLSALSADVDGDIRMPDSQFDDDLEYEDDSDRDIYDSDHEAFADDTHQTTPYSHPTQQSKPNTVVDKAFRDRTRTDLLVAKSAGFKVGHLGHLFEGYNSYVTVSIRMTKLGISEEAMQAWQVVPNDYLILIIQYPNGYKTNEQLQAVDPLRLTANLNMRVCAGKYYKPTHQEAIKLFSTAKNSRESGGSAQAPLSQEEMNEMSVRETFISKPLEGLLMTSLVQILRFRGEGMTWGGAEDWCSERFATGEGLASDPSAKHFEPEVLSDSHPTIVTSDHFVGKGLKQHSFPLLAMQFMLRHFVRCTEFCLVCHRHLDSDLEAIKPYVCDRPLCLYQYMTLGFGPSIEHELLAQPYVVDLLVSFCYSTAFANKLAEYPVGLALVVPPSHPTQPLYSQYPHLEPEAGANKAAEKEAQVSPTFDVGFDRSRQEIVFFTVPEKCPVRSGQWIVVRTGHAGTTELHCRVTDVALFPTISVDEPIMSTPAHTPPGDDENTPSKYNKKADEMPSAPKWERSSFQVYDQDFEKLSNAAKCAAICCVLNTLPNVKEMQKYLAKSNSADLKRWVQRISPPALSILRWIIASNRACIMQVGEKQDNGNGSNISTDRVSGMKDFLQFRFAMGAPDKEQRFLSAVRSTSTRLNLTRYPTLFAFHGSPLHNWHMIIREGLHFNSVAHGRAYGDGVYHAKEAATSTTYAYGRGAANISSSAWASSTLHISSAMALSEIVNAPLEFKSTNPYYVVPQLDWIQTRYLFVQCKPDPDTINTGDDLKPTVVYPQDPTATPTGVSGPIVIPASAIKSKTAITGATSSMSPNKKLKSSRGTSIANAIDLDDNASVSTLDEDRDMFLEEDDEFSLPDSDEPIPIAFTTSKTDFVPGSLNWSTLPSMVTPTYAVSATTRRLMKDLQALAELQESTSLADLGWYIDVEKITNVYQWIVELHSFHLLNDKLPLVADMKAKSITSIVLEMRFNKDFPFTPPYVRVVRPRFLSFNHGGGGHIVMGGAICMELLTNTGWSSVSAMDSVLMQIRLAIASDPPAKIDMRSVGDYGTGEAAEGYLRACRTHGWTVPPGFQEMANGMSANAE